MSKSKGKLMEKTIDLQYKIENLILEKSFKKNKDEELLNFLLRETIQNLKEIKRETKKLVKYMETFEEPFNESELKVIDDMIENIDLVIYLKEKKESNEKIEKGYKTKINKLLNHLNSVLKEKKEDNNNKLGETDKLIINLYIKFTNS